MMEPPILGLRTRTQAPPRLLDGLATAGQQETGQDIPEGLYSRLVAENHIVPSMMRAQADRGETDANFVTSLSFDKVDKDLRMLGVDADPDMRLELYQSVNESDYLNRIGRIDERMALQAEVDKVGGWKAFGLEMATYASDPTAFMIDSVTGLGTKGRLLKRLMVGGAGAALGEAAIQGALAADGETVKASDVALGMGTAFVLGGGIGAAFGKRADVEKQARRAIRKATDQIEGDDGHLSGTSVGAMETAPRSTELEGRTTNLLNLRTDGESVEELGKIRFRLDDSANMWRRAQNNIAQKKLIQKLFPSFILKNREAVDKLSAVEWAEAFVGKHEAELRNDVSGHFSKWLETSQGQQRWKQDILAAAKGGKRINLEEEFHNMLGTTMQKEIAHEDRYMAEVRDILEEAKRTGDPSPVIPKYEPLVHTDVPQEVVDAAEGYFKRYKAMDEELIARGIRELPNVADNGMPKRQRYMPRKISRVKAAEIKDRIAVDAKGRGALDQFTDLVSKALKRGREAAGLKHDSTLNEVVAKAYTRRFLAAHDLNGTYTRDIDFLDELDHEFLTDLLNDAGLEKQELEDALAIIDKGLKQENVDADAAAPARLKHRLAMDLDASIEITNTKGELETITMRDLFETNADNLMFEYTRWAGGEVGLNHHGMSSHDLDRLLKEAGTEASINDIGASTRGSPDQYIKDQVEDLRWMRDRVMGRSVNADQSSRAVRAARAATSVGFITRMGSASKNAAVEAATIMATHNVARVLRNMPAFRSIVQNLRGKSPDGSLARMLSMLDGGISDTMLRGAYTSRHEASAAVLRKPKLNGKLSRGVAAAEDAIEGFKRGAAQLNMLGLFTDASRKVSTVLGLSMLDDIHVRGKKPPSWWTNRAASWGLDADKAKRIGDYLSSPEVQRGNHGVITSLGNIPMQIQDDLTSFLYRFTGETIQNVTQGSLPRWMQKSPLMRVLSQFRSFSTAAWTKHTLKDIHMGDRLGAQKFLVTGGLSTLAYMGQTYIDWFGTDEYKKRMKPSKIIAAGVNYAVNASLIPAAIDQVAALTPYEPPFAQARTSGLTNSLITTDSTGIPIGKYAADAANVVRYGVDNIDSLARGKGFVGPTRSQLRAATNVSMMQTMWFLRPFENRAIEHFGRDDSKRDTYNFWETTGID